MSRSGARRWLAWAAVVLLALLLVVVLAGDGRNAAGSSSLARGPDGWRGMRAVVEARGTETFTLDRPLEDAPSTGTWVLAFPWTGWPRSGDGARVLQHLEAGGDVLLAYSGHRGASWESLLLEELGLPPVAVRSDPPLGPVAWYDHVGQVHRLEAVNERGGDLRPLVLPAPDVAPLAPAGARVLYRLPGGEAAVFTAVYRRGGRLVVVPAAALANAWIEEAGNGDLLIRLADWLSPPWVFDEFHHGLVARGALESDLPVRRALDGVLLHLLALWALAVWALARRLGPPWREEAPVIGSTGAFLRGLGDLHDRLGHHGEGARQLLRRRRALEGEPAPEDDPPVAMDEAGFLALARRWSPGRAAAGGNRGPASRPVAEDLATPSDRRPIAEET